MNARIWRAQGPAALVLSLVLLAAAECRASTIGYWRFEEGAADQVAPTTAGFVVDTTTNDHDGTAQGAPVYRSLVPSAVVPQTGVSNTRSLQVGVANKVLVPSSAQFGLDDFTLEFSVRLDTIGQDSYMVEMSGGSTNNFIVQYVNAGSVIRYGANNNASASFYDYTWAPVINTWYHIAMTRAGSSLKLWVDGVNVQSQTQNALQLVANPINLGGHEGTLSNGLKGYIDEVRISDTALTASTFLIGAAAVPEPGSVALLGFAGAALVSRRRRPAAS